MRLRHLALGSALAFALCGCGSAAGRKPTEAEMKTAMLYEMNHPPGTTITEPVSIKFFKKEACDKPTGQGYNCTFSVQVESTNTMAGFSATLPVTISNKKNKGK